MLVLTRKPGQHLVIFAPCGNRIVIRAASIEENEVRIGIDAPTDWKIYRQEVLQRQEREGVIKRPRRQT